MTVAEIADTEDLADARSRTEDVVGWLANHGVSASARAVAGANEETGQLRKIAKELDAGLVVGGAYGHTRLREWVLGGVTRELLLRPVPLLVGVSLIDIGAALVRCGRTSMSSFRYSGERVRREPSCGAQRVAHAQLIIVATLVEAYALLDVLVPHFGRCRRRLSESRSVVVFRATIAAAGDHRSPAGAHCADRAALQHGRCACPYREPHPGWHEQRDRLG